jgi:hypothetical protein
MLIHVIQDEVQELEPEAVDIREQSGEEAEDWDEEALGLDWNEADEQTLLQEVTSRIR